MDAVRATTVKHGDAAATALTDALPADADLVMVFPAIADIQQHGFGTVAENLSGVFDTVAGVSVGGYATEETDGFQQRGTCAVALSDVSFETERHDNIWEADVDALVQALKEADRTTLTFEAGEYAPTGATWDTLKSFASYVIKRDTLGQRKRLVRKMWALMDTGRIGYSALFRARIRAGLAGEQLANFTSGDTGSYQDGYEIWGGEVTQKRSATLLHLDTTLQMGAARTAITSLSSDRVVERYDTFEHISNIIYLLDGETVADIRDRHGIPARFEDGGFSHYFLIETQGSVFAVPFSSALNVLVSFVDVDPDATISLVEAPSFEEYRESFGSMLDDLPDGVPHLSVLPASLQLYGDRIEDLVSLADERLDTYVFTVEGAFRWYRAIDYNFPGYLVYR